MPSTTKSANNNASPGDGHSSRAPSRQTTATMPFDAASSYAGTLVDAPVYPHASSVKSSDLEITINSPHLELRFPNGELPGPIERVPVFTTKDSIGGTIALNPDTCPSSKLAKLTVALEGSFYWSTQITKVAPAPQVPSLGIRSLSRRSTGPPAPTPTTVEHKHIFFYTSMDLPVTSPDASSENGPSMLDSTLSQTAMAMIRRRMSTGKGDAKPGARKRKHSLSNHLFGGSSTDLHASTASKGPSEASGILASGKPKIVKSFLFQLPLNSDKALPPSFNLKQEALELAGKEKERRSSEEGSNEFGGMGKERECLVKSKLVDDARVEYKLTARWELGGSLHLWSQLDAPFVFEPGSDPESIYAAPAKAKSWTEYPLQASSHSAPPRPAPATRAQPPHGGVGAGAGAGAGIGRSLSLNASSPPFKVVLTLPNPCVVPRDSRDAKTDVQPESLKFFVAYLTTSTATSARERERVEQLAQAIRTSAAVRIEMTCTYGFDKNQAAALVLEGPPTAAAPGSGSGAAAGFGSGAGAGFGASAGVGVGVTTGGGTDGRTDGKNVWKWNEPPTSPLMRHQTRQSEDFRGAPPPAAAAGKGHRRERSLPDLPMQAEERTITIASIERRGFPHRPKEKPGQKNLPDGLWKGALNLHWWMIPSMHWAGLNVKYNITVSVQFENLEFRLTKPFRVVEPHIHRPEVPLPLMKRVELDGVI